MAQQIVFAHEHENQCLLSREVMDTNKLYWKLGHMIKLNNNVRVVSSGGVNILYVPNHVKREFVVGVGELKKYLERVKDERCETV